MVNIEFFGSGDYLSRMPFSPAQCRAARALLGWTQDDLAERAEVSRGTIRGFESGQHALQRATSAAVCRALEAAGVRLMDADEQGGQGVRLAGPAEAAPPAGAAPGGLGVASGD